MDFGAGLREVVGIPFSQQHRAFDSLGLGQLRRFFFGELNQGLTDAAGLGSRLSRPVGPAGNLRRSGCRRRCRRSDLKGLWGVGRRTPFNA